MQSNLKEILKGIKLWVNSKTDTLLQKDTTSGKKLYGVTSGGTQCMYTVGNGLTLSDSTNILYVNTNTIATKTYVSNALSDYQPLLSQNNAGSGITITTDEETGGKIINCTVQSGNLGTIVLNDTYAADLSYLSSSVFLDRILSATKFIYYDNSDYTSHFILNPMYIDTSSHPIITIYGEGTVDCSHLTPNDSFRVECDVDSQTIQGYTN